MDHQRKNFGIIKVGTDVVTNPETGFLEKDVIQHIVGQVASVREQLGQVCIVTSGAIAAGRAELNGLLGVSRDRETTEDKQLYATSGQAQLHATYEEYLRFHGLYGVQILPTKADYSRKKFRSLFERAISHPSIIPIVNENDALTDDEIRYSDNDELAADLAIEFGANRLIILSQKPLQRDVDDSSTRISQVPFGDRSFEQYIHDSKSQNGKGGMKAKCGNLVRATTHHIEGGIINGREQNALVRFVTEEIQNRPGTTFLPSPVS